MDAAQALQAGSTWVLNLALGVLIGLACAQLWLETGADATERAMASRFARVWLPAALVCLLAQVGALWAAAAAMGGVAPTAAGPVFWTMLTATTFGHACLIGLASAGLLLVPRWPALARLGLIVILCGCRAANSHAAEGGIASVSFVVEWAHLALVAFWFGAVAVAAWLVLPDASTVPALYMRRLSDGATLALAGIVATGAYNAWRGIGSLQQAVGNAYANVLLAKLVLVGLAAGLGGVNKFVVFPRAERGQLPALSHARRILQLESCFLAAALLAAAILVMQQPPAMG